MLKLVCMATNDSAFSSLGSKYTSMIDSVKILLLALIVFEGHQCISTDGKELSFFTDHLSYVLLLQFQQIQYVTIFTAGSTVVLIVFKL